MNEVKVAVVGSRDWPYPNIIEILFKRLGPFVIVSGGARGVDAFAEAYAKIHNWPEPIIHHAEWDKYKGRPGKNPAGVIRNTAVINDSEAAVVFWDGESPGTKDVLTKARKKGIPIILCKLTDGALYITVENADDGQFGFPQVTSLNTERG